MIHPFRFEEKQKMEEKMGDEQPVLTLELDLHWTNHRPDSKKKKKERRGIEKS